jgi:hypothetical protein
LHLLSRERDRIAKLFVSDLQSWEEAQSSLTNAVCDLWGRVAKRPLIFSGFAIPPKTRADRAVVHNWTFATLAFAETYDQLEVIRKAMEPAWRAEDLADGMASGSAARPRAGDDNLLDPASFTKEPADAFYMKLGERLLMLEESEQTRT